MSIGYIYDMILSPISTEKTQKQLSENKYSFYVAFDATKNDIKKAIKELFCVDVESVNIINTEGKTKKFKGTIGRKSDRKKAIIGIKKGQEINFSKLEDK